MIDRDWSVAQFALQIIAEEGYGAQLRRIEAQENAQMNRLSRFMRGGRR